MSRNIWVTSDTHYDHANIILFSERPFYHDSEVVVTEEGRRIWVDKETANKRVDEMNEAMIEWHNEMVKPGDEVYHLGDFCFGRTMDVKARVEGLVRQLNGQYHWVFGNHDHHKARRAEGFVTKQYYKELRKVGPDKQHMLCLSHYAMRVWNKRHHGSIQLYGHSHGSLPEAPDALQMDVGVDCWNYRPVHLDAVLEIMHEKQQRLIHQDIHWKGEDHHGSRQGE